MTFLTFPENKGKKTGFVQIKNAKFKRKIVPGDKLDIKAELSSYRRGLAIGFVKSFVGNEPACELELVVAVPDILNQFKPKVKE